MEAMVISLPDELRRDLDVLAQEDRVTTATLLERAVSNYVFVRRFRTLRARLMADMPKSFTDDDVFALVS